ncbi:MAG: CapA family protein, partial [Myxococcales bacterium]|nr:CapA family protein [Myxococcales bacterium]
MRLPSPAVALLLALGPACPKPTPADDGSQSPPGQEAQEDAAGPPSPLAGSLVAGRLAAEAALVRQSEGPTTPEIEAEPPWTLPEDYLRFDGACSPGRRVSLAFAGDLLLHHELQKQAYAAPTDQGAAVIWDAIADLLAAPDFTYLNLEGPIAPGLDRDFLEVEDPGRTYDRVVYTGYPRFNYHPSVAVDLARAGVDLVSTANNHALDRGPVGVDRTIAALHKAKLEFVGTREQGGPERWYTITEVEGLKIGWIACTKHTNQIADDFEQVLRCGNGSVVAKTIERLRATGRYAKREPV